MAFLALAATWHSTSREKQPKIGVQWYSCAIVNTPKPLLGSEPYSEVSLEESVKGTRNPEKEPPLP